MDSEAFPRQEFDGKDQLSVPEVQLKNISLIADFKWSVKVINAYKYMSKIEKSWVQNNRGGEFSENAIQIKNLTKHCAQNIKKMQQQTKDLKELKDRPVYITEGYSKFLAGFRVKREEKTQSRQTSMPRTMGEQSMLEEMMNIRNSQPLVSPQIAQYQQQSRQSNMMLQSSNFNNFSAERAERPSDKVSNQNPILSEKSHVIS